MPAHRKPTEVLEASGAFKINPHRGRARSNEPVPTGDLGPAPKHLTAPQKKNWRELESIAPPGVLKDADRWIVEVCVVLMTKIRTGTFNVAEVSHLRQCLASLGLTPADRSRVAVTPTKTEEDNDEWGALVQ